MGKTTRPAPLTAGHFLTKTPKTNNSGTMLYSLIEQHVDGSWWYHPGDTFNTPEEVEARFKESFWWDLERPHKVFEHEEPMCQEYHTHSFDLKKFEFGGLVLWPKKYYGTFVE